jgi:hypothetical protein
MQRQRLREFGGVSGIMQEIKGAIRFPKAQPCAKRDLGAYSRGFAHGHDNGLRGFGHLV